MLRLAVCLPFVLACTLRADDKSPQRKESPLRQGTVKVQGDNLVCVVNMPRTVEREVAETVVERNQEFTVKRIVTVVEYVPTERIIPLNEVKGYVVAGRQKLRSLDPSKTREVVEKDWRGWFVAADEKAPEEVAVDFKPGLVIFILPQEKKEHRR